MEIGFLFLMLSAFGQIPDYDDPYAPIYTDKPTYTWTDKITITIVAPSWNSNRYGVDSIGGEQSHAIRISTPEHSLEPYRLTETGPNTGIFTGEVTLTGFLHDVDGDGNFDTSPRTMGGGPTDGLLETKRDSGITISFEFADGVVLTSSTKVSWNVGTVKFSSDSYSASDTVSIRVIDQDMNLNPEAPDQVILEVSSDTDLAGVSVTATETEDDSGVFTANVLLTMTGQSSGNRLHAVPGDSITAKYRDRTLPAPYSISDEQDIEAVSYIGSDTPQTERITLGTTRIADSFGNETQSMVAGEKTQLVSNIQNNEDYPQQFTCIMQVSNSNGIIESLAWVSGQLTAGQSFDVSQSWTPQYEGTYTIETFVWRSLDDPRPLSESNSLQITVHRQ